MGDEFAQQRSGHDFDGNQAGGDARQQNGDQIYSNVQSVHHGDTHYNTQAGPTFIPGSGHYAVQNGQTQAATMLLNRGADPGSSTSIRQNIGHTTNSGCSQRQF
ncbi:hypothetical protein AC579_5224 [Pseudocercospora musae]|uniref:Uncharacterized protein n=1 Tax=Pseudocercospora musae TaxID=113226 RepID=A0A139ID64_9PEZI|nr:hypothetical protein AC579_5224 [Pseudocercospora musae]